MNRYQYSQIASIPTDSHITAVCYSPSFIAYGDDAGNVYVTRASNLQTFRAAASIKGTVSSIHLTETCVFVTSLGGNWHLLTLEVLPEPLEEIAFRDFAHNGAINDSAFRLSTGRLVTAGSDGLLKVWTVGAGGPVTESGVVDMRSWGEVTFVSWAMVTDRWVTAHSDGQVRVWPANAVNCGCIQTISCGICRVTALTIDENGIVLAALNDKTIRCFAMETGEMLRTLAGHQGAICSLAAREGIDCYVSGSWDRTMKVWPRLDLGAAARRATSSASVRRRDVKVTRKEKVPRPETRSAMPVYQPVSLYEKKKQEIERKRRRERLEYEAKMRTPVARDLRTLQKMIWELL
jgi:WD40 repeat protein